MELMASLTMGPLQRSRCERERDERALSSLLRIPPKHTLFIPLLARSLLTESRAEEKIYIYMNANFAVDYY
jgi:hypothetical protein